MHIYFFCGGNTVGTELELGEVGITGNAKSFGESSLYFGSSGNAELNDFAFGAGMICGMITPGFSDVLGAWTGFLVGKIGGSSVCCFTAGTVGAGP